MFNNFTPKWSCRNVEKSTYMYRIWLNQKIYIYTNVHCIYNRMILLHNSRLWSQVPIIPGGSKWRQEKSKERSLCAINAFYAIIPIPALYIHSVALKNLNAGLYRTWFWKLFKKLFYCKPELILLSKYK